MTVEQLKTAVQQIVEWIGWFTRKRANPAIIEPAPPLPVVPPPEAPKQPPPLPPKPDYLTLMANAIASYEGGPGDRNHLNNNPGNLRSWPGYPTAHGFALFPSWDVGMMALKTMLKHAAKGLSASYQPNMTLIQFFSKYAPSNDGNNPNLYAMFAAKRMGVSPSWQIKNLV